MVIKDSLGVEIDLTGHTFRGQIRKTVSNVDIEAAFSFVIADQITDTGKVTCTISATDTALIDTAPSPNAERKITKMAYDIESQDAGGIVNRWLQGVAEINPEATR